jgi:hypothetical protein
MRNNNRPAQSPLDEIRGSGHIPRPIVYTAPVRNNHLPGNSRLDEIARVQVKAYGPSGKQRTS